MYDLVLFVERTGELRYVAYLHGGSEGEESAGNAGDSGSVPGLGRSPGGGNGNPLMDREAW